MIIPDLPGEAAYWNKEYEELFGVNPRIEMGCSMMLVAHVQSAILRARNEELKAVARDMGAQLLKMQEATKND